MYSPLGNTKQKGVQPTHTGSICRATEMMKMKEDKKEMRGSLIQSQAIHKIYHGEIKKPQGKPRPFQKGLKKKLLSSPNAPKQENGSHPWHLPLPLS